MSRHSFLSAVFCLGLLLGAVLPSFAEDCEFRDEMGDSLINNGGEFLAGIFALLRGQNIQNIPEIFEGSYETWDINDDGTPDAEEFELLTEILCLPDGVEHPLLDIAGLKAAFHENLATYWDLVYVIFDNEEEIVELAPMAKEAGRLLRLAILPARADIQYDELDPCVFKDCDIPEYWADKTYQDLADTLYNLGADVGYLIDNDFYGVEDSTLRYALDNRSTAAFMAAAMGSGKKLLEEFFNINRFGALTSGLVLARLDWDFINDLLGAYALPEEDSSGFGDFYASLELPEDIIPDPEEDIEYFEWNDVFHDDDFMSGDIDIDELIASVLDNLIPFSVPVRVVHASPGLDAIAICQGDEFFQDGLAFKDISPYETAYAWHPDFLYDFGLVTEGDDCSSPQLSDSWDLDNTSTLIVLNTADDPEMLMVEDILDMPRTGRARIRFINTSPDAGPLTLTGRLGGGDEEDLFASLNFKGVSSYRDVNPGLYQLDFISAIKGEIVLPSETLALHGGSVYTIFAMGLAEDMEMNVNQDAVAVTATLTVSPERTNFFVNEPVRLEVECSETLEPPLYFWYRDGVALDISGPVLDLPAISLDDAGNYMVYITAKVEGIKDSIQVTALAPTIKVTRATVSISGRREIASGDDIRLTANVSGDVTVKSWNWTWAGGTLPGVDTTLQNLVIENVDDEQRGTYRVEVEVALSDYPDVHEIIAAEVFVRIDMVPMPLTGVLGMLFVALALAGFGLHYSRRRHGISGFEK
ncbi:MAG: DUF4397 domain-containing protein [Candidatus Hydrogenedens sp.]|jgi:hypothetical protein|nr:DUF4397 domain-containing protein [Candidatus Hydrogenedens sp.]